MRQQCVRVYLKVRDAIRNTYNFPKGFPHCYNCIHAGICAHEHEADEKNDIETKRFCGSKKARTCASYQYDAQNFQTPQPNRPIDSITAQELQCFYAIAQLLEKTPEMARDEDIPNEVPVCSRCMHKSVCKNAGRALSEETLDCRRYHV